MTYKYRNYGMDMLFFQCRSWVAKISCKNFSQCHLKSNLVSNNWPLISLISLRKGSALVWYSPEHLLHGLEVLTHKKGCDKKKKTCTHTHTHTHNIGHRHPQMHACTLSPKYLLVMGYPQAGRDYKNGGRSLSPGHHNPPLKWQNSSIDAGVCKQVSLEMFLIISCHC